MKNLCPCLVSSASASGNDGMSLESERMIDSNKSAHSSAVVYLDTSDNPLDNSTREKLAAASL